MRRLNFSYLSVFALVIVALAFVFGYLGAEAQTPVGSGFTYQGRMFDVTNAPVQGICDLALRLYDQDSGGAQIGSTVTITSVAMSDGYFDVTPDFGALSFNGEARWLEIESACPPGAGATTFPRQAINIVPYALYALNSSITSTVYMTETFYYTPTTHDLLSAVHGDTTVASPVRGDIIAGQGASPTWTSLTKGLAYAVLTGDGTDTAWSTFLLSGIAGGKTNFNVTNAKTLTLTSANNYNLTAEQSGAVLVRTATPNIVADPLYGSARGIYAVDLQMEHSFPDEVASGESSFAGGEATLSSGYVSFAYGHFARAKGDHSVAMGDSVYAVGTHAIALGDYAYAKGDNSIALGRKAYTSNSSMTGKAGTFIFGDSTNEDFYASVADEFAVRARGGLRHAWDNSNYWIAQVSNAGAVTLKATGSSAGFTFSNPITVPSPLTIGTSQLSLPIAWPTIVSIPSTYTPTAHTQDWSTITGQPATYTPTAHTQDWSTITGQPASYTPTLGAHTWTGLQTFNAGASATSGQFIDALTDGSTGGLRAGASLDVLLYRSATDTWRTPDSLIVNGNLSVGTITADAVIQATQVGNADPTAPGMSNAALFLSNADKLYGLYAGVYGSGKAWLQVARNDAATYYDLVLQPLGGNVSIGTTIPNASNTYDLGSAENYWATIHYHTLTSHSLSVFSTTVTLQDGREVSCLDALKEIKADPTKKVKGVQHMDYATVPSVALNAAPWSYNGSTLEQNGEDGADLDMMVSLVLCADKELDAKSTALDNRMSDLEKRLADLEQKVK